MVVYSVVSMHDAGKNENAMPSRIDLGEAKRSGAVMEYWLAQVVESDIRVGYKGCVWSANTQQSIASPVPMPLV